MRAGLTVEREKEELKKELGDGTASYHRIFCDDWLQTELNSGFESGLAVRPERPIRYLHKDRSLLLCPLCMSRELEHRKGMKKELASQSVS
jgi:hypothetical protein